MNFTLGNHLKYSIGDRVFGCRHSVREHYRVQVGAVDHAQLQRSSWVQEQLRTADSVYQQFGERPAVMFSGGTDSEIVIRSFLKIGVTPHVFFIRFKDGYNEQDFVTAQHTAGELGIPLHFFNFDVVDFVRSGAAAELAARTACSQLAYLTVYHHIQQLASPTVMGGESLLRRHVSAGGSRWYLAFRENEDASAMRFSALTGIPLVNEWFSYTPEMLAYWILHPTIAQLVTQPHNFKLSSVSSKNHILSSLLPELSWRQKTHGYEQLLAFNEHSRRVLAGTFTRRLTADLDGIFIDDLKQQLGIGDTQWA